MVTQKTPKEETKKKRKAFPISAVAVALMKQHGFEPDIAYLSAWYSRHSEMPRASWYQMLAYMQRVKRMPAITEAEAEAMLQNYTRGR